MVLSSVKIVENSIETFGPATGFCKTPVSMKILEKGWVPSLMNFFLLVKNDLHYFSVKLSLLSKNFEAITKALVIVGVETCWQLI